MVTRRHVCSAVLTALAIAAGLVNVWPSPAEASPGDAMEMEDVGTSVAIGGTVDADLRITEADTGYHSYRVKLEYDASKLEYVGCEYTTGMGLLAIWPVCPVVADGGGPGINQVQAGGALATGTTHDTGVPVSFTFECLSQGTAILHLVPPVGDEFNTTLLAPGGEIIPTTLTDGSIFCEDQADIQVTKDAPETVLANEVFDYVVTVHNAGPNPAQMVVIGDNLPEYPIEDDPASLPQKEYLSYELYVDGSGPLPLCEFYPAWVHPITLEELRNIVICDLSALDPFEPGSTAVLTITVQVPVSDAGQVNVNTAPAGSLATYDPDLSNEPDCASLDPPLPDANFGCAVTQVLPLSAGTATPLPTATPTPLATATITPTPTITLTPTVTPTQPPCIDWFGDTACDAPTDDSDNDGCTDTQEAALGDNFRPDAWFDVYDVPVPAKADVDGANGTRNGLVDMGDVLAVAFYAFADNDGPPNSSGVDYDSVKGWDLDGDSSDDVGASPGIEEGLKYDRSPGLPPSSDTGLDPAGPPNGAIDMADVLAVAAQAFAIDCTAP